jgi:hypothetical protein
MIPRDRVISSVVRENEDIKLQLAEVMAANDRLREEIEDVISKNQQIDMTQEQLSIF